MAGSKKQNWQRTAKNHPGYFGRKGFKRHVKSEDLNTMNVGPLSENIKNIVSEGHAKESKGSYTVDLVAAGVDKLLGCGKVDKKMEITVTSCSEKAREKIEAAGGKINTSNQIGSEQTIEDEGD
jgi:large subunit ribosomal protein L15